MSPSIDKKESAICLHSSPPLMHSSSGVLLAYTEQTLDPRRAEYVVCACKTYFERCVVVTQMNRLHFRLKDFSRRCKWDMPLCFATLRNRHRCFCCHSRRASYTESHTHPTALNSVCVLRHTANGRKSPVATKCELVRPVREPIALNFS